ncbi:MAG: tetratricopeptide repeat protein [Gammaproteobacteria bacterium]
MFRLCVLAFLLALGSGVQAEQQAPQDDVRQAAMHGNAKAQAKLGAMYLLGRDGVEIDEKKAAEWLLKSANQGFIEAEVVMAALYDRGIGVKNDVKMATAWYEKAAAQGHGPSLAILGKNAAAKGAIAFNYQAMRLTASKQIPREYANRILLTK